MAGDISKFRIRKRNTIGEKALDSGPKTGGILVVPIYQKIDGNTTPANVGEWVPTFVGRCVAVAGHHAAATAFTRIQLNLVNITHTTVTQGMYVISNGGRGNLGTDPDVLGFKWIRDGLTESARSFAKASAAHRMFVDGTGGSNPVRLFVSAHIFMAVQDHPYGVGTTDTVNLKYNAGDGDD